MTAGRDCASTRQGLRVAPLCRLMQKAYGIHARFGLTIAKVFTRLLHVAQI